MSVPSRFRPAAPARNAWRALASRGQRLLRDAALWLRAPAGQRPEWMTR